MMKYSIDSNYYGVQIYRTDKDGEITIEVTRNLKYKLEKFIR